MTSMNLRLTARVWAPITAVFCGHRPLVSYGVRDQVALQIWDRLQTIFFFDASVTTISEPLLQRIQQHVTAREAS